MTPIKEMNDSKVRIDNSLEKYKANETPRTVSVPKLSVR